MILETQARSYKRLYTTGQTDTSFPSRIPTTTEPATGDGILDLGGRDGAPAPSHAILVPFGAGSDNTTFDARVIGWRNVGTLWVPMILLQFSVTLSAAVGVAGAEVVATERFGDTLSDPATGMGTKGTDCTVTTPANDTPGHYVVDLKGCRKLEIVFDMTGATNGNMLVALL